jgi:hypothetical protein
VIRVNVEVLLNQVPKIEKIFLGASDIISWDTCIGSQLSGLGVFDQERNKPVGIANEEL